MYNKKSKASAILSLITILLLVGLMIWLPFMQIKTEEGNELGAGLAAFVTILFGYPLIYIASCVFGIVALIFSILMLKQQARKKLIGYNVRMLITACILLPVLAIGLYIGCNIIFQTVTGVWPIIYTMLAVAAYLASLISYIVSIVALKKSPEEAPATEPKQDTPVA